MLDHTASLAWKNGRCLKLPMTLEPPPPGWSDRERTLRYLWYTEERQVLAKSRFRRAPPLRPMDPIGDFLLSFGLTASVFSQRIAMIFGGITLAWFWLKEPPRHSQPD